jgi:glycosyltransferase involved in cell wall biosynthesis
MKQVRMNKKLSIITVNLNNKEGLRNTIESVISQIFPDYEYIIIDGGSTDGSVDIIKQYTNKITYWISEPDTGIFNAMNKGVCQAKGEYCLFLNSGDAFYSKEVLETVFRENYEEDIITGNIIEVHSDKTTLRKGRPYVRAQEGRDLTAFDLFAGSLFHQATFVRKKLFDQYGLYDERYRIVSDSTFFFNLIVLKGIKLKYIDAIIVYFDMNGISNVNRTLDEKEREEAFRDLLPPAIWEDYVYFRKIELDFHNLLKYRTSYRAGRFINKLVTLYEIVTRKIKHFFPHKNRKYEERIF